MLRSKLWFAAFVPMLALAGNPYMIYGDEAYYAQLKRQMQEQRMSPEQFRIRRDVSQIIENYQDRTGQAISINAQSIAQIARQVRTNDYAFVEWVMRSYQQANEVLEREEDFERDLKNRGLLP